MHIRSKFFFIALISLIWACQPTGGKQSTPSGYEYAVHLSPGGQKTAPGDYMYFHAQMRNGETVVYSTREQNFGVMPSMQYTDPPADQPPSPVAEVLQELSVGDSATVYINIDTMPQKPQGFEDASVLEYDIVLMEIKSEEEFKAEQQRLREEQQQKAGVLQARFPEIRSMMEDRAKKYAAGSLNSEIQTTASGLKYIIHEQGSGAQAVAGKTVSVNYYGMLTDGKLFDNSFEPGRPIEFPLGVGRVIPGWDEGLALLNGGGKATLFIPSNLGYGDQGSPPAIPGGAELIFYVELD